MIRNVGSTAARLVCAALLVLGLTSGAALAQAVTGTILGTVTDSTGAVVANAKVTIVNEGTGLTRVLTADANGEYTAPALPTGHYTITSEMTGFKTVALSNIEVGVDQRVRINIKHEVGAMTESVSVQAETPLLQTSSSELGTTVTNEQIEALPLNGRNFVNLTRTIPGVLRGIPGANIDGAGSLAWRASASFSANGQRPRDNNYMLDGVDNNETWLQTVVIFPSVDALDEFKMQTSTYSAEYGRSLGGVVNLQIKSGTNMLPRQRLRVPPQRSVRCQLLLQQPRRTGQAGFQAESVRRHARRRDLQGQDVLLRRLSGPPGDRRASRSCRRSPRSRCARGDFSEITRPIFDPTTGQQFPGNVIPDNRIDGVARNILTQLYPEPNATGSRSAANGQTINNYVINPIKERQDNQFDVKIDHSLTGSNRFFTRYSFQKTHRLQPATLPHGDAGATFGAGEGDIKAMGLAFNDTHTFGSLVERVPVRVVVDQVPDDADRLRHEPGAGRRSAGHQPERGHVGLSAVHVSRTSATSARTPTSP